MDQVTSIKAVIIPRAEDLPYFTSPPVQFVYRQTANVAAGSYTFAGNPVSFAPARPILPTSMYYIRSISLSADIDEGDYLDNITTILTFSLYHSSRLLVLREPIQVLKYEQFDYRLFWQTHQSSDQFQGLFQGVINQGVNLIGKTSVTATAIITATEISDINFISQFKRAYLQGVS